MSKTDFTSLLDSVAEETFKDWQDKAIKEVSTLFEDEYSVMKVVLRDGINPAFKKEKFIQLHLDIKPEPNGEFSLELGADTEIGNMVLHAHNTGTAQMFNEEILEFFDAGKMDEAQKKTLFLDTSGWKSKFKNDLIQILDAKRNIA